MTAESFRTWSTFAAALFVSTMLLSAATTAPLSKRTKGPCRAFHSPAASRPVVTSTRTGSDGQQDCPSVRFGSPPGSQRPVEALLA